MATFSVTVKPYTSPLLLANAQSPRYTSSLRIQDLLSRFYRPSLKQGTAAPPKMVLKSTALMSVIINAVVGREEVPRYRDNEIWIVPTVLLLMSAK